MAKYMQLLFLCPGILLFGCLFFPIIWGEDYYINEIEIHIILLYIAILSLFFTLSYLLKKRKITINKIDILLLLYFIYTLSFCYTYPINKFSLISIAIFVLFYIYFRLIPVKYIYIFLLLLILSSTVQIFFSIYNFSEPGSSLSDIKGIFSNTGIFGGFVSVSLVTVLGLLFFAFRRNIIAKIFLILLFCLFCLQLYFTYSRASWLAVIFGGVFLIIIAFKEKIKSIHISNFIKLIIFITVIISSFFTVINLYQLKKNSADGRLLIWDVSWKMIKDAPISGHGLNSFEANYMSYQANYFKENKESKYNMLADDTFYPFNEILKIGVEQGIIGILFTIVIIFVLFKNSSKNYSRNKKEYYLLYSIFIAILVFSLFSYPFRFQQFNTLILFLIALLSSKEYPIKIININQKVCLPIVILSILLISKLAIVSFDYHMQLSRWKKANIEYNFNKENALKTLSHLRFEFEENTYFMLSYGIKLSYSDSIHLAIPILEKVKTSRESFAINNILGKCYKSIGKKDVAIRLWEEASYMIPSRFETDYLITKTLNENGETKLAKKKGKQLLAKKIKYNTPEIRSMLNQINQIVEN